MHLTASRKAPARNPLYLTPESVRKLIMIPTDEMRLPVLVGASLWRFTSTDRGQPRG